MSFGRNFYWRGGIIGVMLGLGEFSFTQNLHKIDEKKQELADALEEHAERLKEKVE